MRNDNNYNNDFIDPTTIDAEKAELVAEETVPVEAKNSFWQNLKSFFVISLIFSRDSGPEFEKLSITAISYPLFKSSTQV